MIHPENRNIGIGRRQLLQTVISGAVLGAAIQAGIELASHRQLYAQTNLSPDEALHELLTGNQRFAADRLTSITHDLNIMKERTVNKQEPFAAVLTCADSRIPVELVFDQTIGHLFVTRVAGNVANHDILGSLEFAGQAMSPSSSESRAQTSDERSASYAMRA